MRRLKFQRDQRLLTSSPTVFKETPKRWAVFQIKNPRWADYWQQQAYAVIRATWTTRASEPPD